MNYNVSVADPSNVIASNVIASNMANHVVYNDPVIPQESDIMVLNQRVLEQESRIQSLESSLYALKIETSMILQALTDYNAIPSEKCYVTI